jgi:dihydroflavonol-4-reductase
VNVVLVTGATGFIGSTLAAALLRAGREVRVFRRAGSDTRLLEGLGVEHSIGDTRDQSALRAAVRGCDTVFHAAAIVSFWKKRYAEQIEVNAGGTANVVRACLESGVRKLVHTSSVAALGYRTDGLFIDETTAYNWGPLIGYRYSKHLAELEVLRGVREGLDATMVNPSVVIGPGDISFHGGQVIREIKRGIVPFYIAGGTNYVSVHDVVRGHIAAAERGRPGERYILGGENLTHKEVFKKAARATGGRAPSWKVPVGVAKGAARALDLLADLTSTQPRVSPDLLSGAGMTNWYSIEKAERELEYRPAPVEDAMREAYRWYVERGLL